MSSKETTMVRFCALRPREAGMVKSAPQRLIGGTDWRIMEQLRKEMKS